MRAKLLLGSSRRQKTYRGRTWMQPFQTFLQIEEGLTGPTCEGGLLPGLGAKVRCRRTMRNRIQWRGQSVMGWLLYINDSSQPLLRHLPRFGSCQAGHNSLFVCFFLLKTAYQNPREWEWCYVHGFQTVCQDATEHHSQLRGAPLDILNVSRETRHPLDVVLTSSSR